MMAIEKVEEESSNSFMLLLEEAMKKLTVTTALSRYKNSAWEQFQKRKLPSRKDEAFNYLRLNNFFSNTFSFATDFKVDIEEIRAHILPECQNNYLTFVQGQFVPELSCLDNLPKKVVVSSLESAAQNFNTLLSNSWQSSLPFESDPFYLINAAVHKEAAFIYIPPKTVLAAPIQIINYTTAEDNGALSLPKAYIYLGAQSQAAIVQTHIHKNQEKFHCHSSALDIFLEEQAQLSYTHIEENMGERLWKFEALRASLKKNSSFISTGFTAGSSSIRHDYHVTLAGEGAHAELNAINILSQKNEAHAHVLVEHKAPNCSSMQRFKSVLKDQSRSSFEGKIFVHQIAQKTDAYQRSNNLILGPFAQAYAKPNLEIYADDVKASHGATFGQVDKEQLLYLKTRGLTTSQAMELLVYGFCEEVIQQIKIASLQTKLNEKLRQGVVGTRND